MGSNSPSKRRHKHKIEPITMDELINAAGMSGYVSFLNVKPEEYGRGAPMPASTVDAGAPATVDVAPAPVLEADEPATTVVAESPAMVDAALTTMVADVSAAVVDVEPAPTVVAGKPELEAIAGASAEPGEACFSLPTPASTVAVDSQPTVDAARAPTVAAALPPVAPLNFPATTVVVGPTPTVAVATASPIDVEPAPTVPLGIPSTVYRGSSSTGDLEPPSTVYWTAEGIGGVFPPSRLRKIQLAQDALTHAEESVYDALWGVKDQSRDRERLTSMGYETISRAARVSKRNAAAIVQRLIQKGFIEVSAPPVTFGARQATVYRVFGYAAVREDQRRKNRVWTIRTGNGIGYARPLAIRLDPATTVDAGLPSTADAGESSTVDAAQRSTVDAAQSTTVDAASTRFYIDTKSSQKPSLTALDEAAARWGLDDDAVRKIGNGARRHAPDASDDEVACWIERKAALLARRKDTANLVGLLITAVPKAFEGRAFLEWRETRAAERKAEAARAERELRQAAEEQAEQARAEALEKAWESLPEEDRARRESAELPRVASDHPMMTPPQRAALALKRAKEAFREQLGQGTLGS